MHDLYLFLKNNEKQLERVNKLIDPLKTHYGIDVFWYGTIAKNGCLYGGMSYHDPLMHFYLEGWYQQTKHLTSPDNLKEGFYLMDNDEGYEMFLENIKVEYPVYHNFLLVKKEPNGDAALYCFGSKTKKPQLISLYINNLAMLAKFCEYFKEKNSTYLKANYDAQLNLLQIKGKEAFYGQKYASLASINPDRNICFLNAIDVESFPVQLAKKLSSREREVIAFLVDGKSTEEISKTLKLSRRTVEHYIDNTKNKLGVDSKHELIKQGHLIKTAGLL